MHRHLLLTLTLPLAVVTLGCPSPSSLCKSGVDQVCERVHECQSDAVKGAPQFQAVFGTSEDDCKTKLYANPGLPAGATALACDSVETDQQLCTNLGQPNATEFDLKEAQLCKGAREDLSCADYLAQLQNPALAPIPCGYRCK